MPGGKATVTWSGTGKAAQCAPNPAYPKGIDLDLRARSSSPSCNFPLPYPAECIGTWIVECDVCGLRIGVTAAGRPDDPRAVRVPCRLKGVA